MTGCRARIYAQYSQKTKKLQDEEEPIVDQATLCSAADHVLKDGTQHPVQVGLRLLEEFRRRVREAIREDPTRPVAQTYEAQMTEMSSSLDGQDREDFIAHCPNLRAMERSLYRYSQNRLKIGLKL